MSEAVLDASAVLAMMRNERGGASVRQLIRQSIMSAVNLSEVLSKLIDYGAAPESAREAVSALPCKVEPFDLDQALAAGKMRTRARETGLSLGDRACLALAEARDLPAVTADTRWNAFQSTVEIRQLR